MASIEEIGVALLALVEGNASDVDLELVREALASGQLQRLTGERAVAVGGDANGSTFVTGDKNVVVSFPAADAAAIDRAFERLFPSRRRQLPADLADFAGRERTAAKGKQLPWRWDCGTISTNLDGISGMSAKRDHAQLE
ncbi:MAG: hypothetical protein ACE10M_00430 [Alphaproteobacteria bacterium]